MRKIFFAVLLCTVLMFFCGTAIAATWATIDPIEDVILGDNITFSGETNVRIDQDVFLRIYTVGSKDGKEQLTQHAILRAPVTKGNGTQNHWSLSVPTGNNRTGTFLVTAEGAPTQNGTKFNITVKADGWWITIDPIPDYPTGSSFAITGTTNIRAGYLLYGELMPSWIYNDRTSSIPAPSNSLWNRVIIESGENGINLWSFPVTTTYPEEFQIRINKTRYPPGEYQFQITALYTLNDPQERMRFNLTEPVIPESPAATTQVPGFVAVATIFAAAAAFLFRRR